MIPPDWTVAVERVFLALCLLAFVGFALASVLRAPRPRVSRGTLWASVGVFALLFVVRMALPGALVHASSHGYGLVQVLFDFPESNSVHAQFGQTSFLLVGLATWVFGDKLDVVFAVNALFGSGIVLLAALLARQATGRAVAFWVTAAAGLLLPLFVRIASSEDSHNAAALFGLLSFLLLDRANRVGDNEPRRLVLPLFALVFAFFGRQTMVGFAPLFAIAIPRATWGRILRSWRSLAVLVLVLAAFGLRVMASRDIVYGTAFDLVFSTLPLMLSPEMLGKHPFFQPSSIAFMVLALAGVVALWRRFRNRVFVAMALGVVGNFLLSWPASIFPGYHGNLGMRLPAAALALPLVGVGAVWLLEHVREASPGRPALQAAWFGVLVAGAALAPLGGYAELFEHRDEEAQELRSIARHVGAIDPASSIVVFPHRRDRDWFPPGYPHPGVFPLEYVTAYEGETVEYGGGSSPFRTLYVYRGAACNFYSLLGGGDMSRFPRDLGWDGFLPYVGLFLDGWERPRAFWEALAGKPAPDQIREECRGLPEGVEARFEPWEPIEFTLQEPPGSLFVEPEFQSGVWVVDDPEMIRRALEAYDITLRARDEEP